MDLIPGILKLHLRALLAKKALKLEDDFTQFTLNVDHRPQHSSGTQMSLP